MKIPKSLRDIYLDYSKIYKNLKEKVDEKLKNRIESTWHYFSRIKEQESFALKIESGRYESMKNFDDFFACTIVVENMNNISKARILIEELFDLSYCNPENNSYTYKDAESFPFDDLRLYVYWKDHPGSKPTEFNELLFEIQIKTFLQHAWSIATHDLIYKTAEINWSKERIAYQIKAMLEHAELSIYESEVLSKSESIKKDNKKTAEISEFINFLIQKFNNENLPKNLRLLADNVSSLLKKIGIDLKNLTEILDRETKNNMNVRPLNLSPFGIITQSLINQETEKMKKLLYSSKNKKRLYICDEISFPEQIDLNKCNNKITF
jgi:ppGpp synthetase/RelA/SpoT-type nucleotidyltranferase